MIETIFCLAFFYWFIAGTLTGSTDPRVQVRETIEWLKKDPRK